MQKVVIVIYRVATRSQGMLMLTRVKVNEGWCS